MPLPGVTRLCGAKCRDGHACTNPAMPNGRCRKHAGKARSGIAHPNYKTGRWSEHLPARMRARYEAAVGDPELLDMGQDIAMLDARLADLLARVDKGEAGALWQTVNQDFRALRNAITLGDANALKVALDDLGRVIAAGSQDYAAWSEIRGLLDQRRRTVESQQKLLVAKNQIITADQAMLLAQALMSAVRLAVTDAAVLQRVQLEFDRLMTMPERDNKSKPGLMP